LSPIGKSGLLGVKYMLYFSPLFWIVFLDLPPCENVKKIQK
jgi:hypothetical protein